MTITPENIFSWPVAAWLFVAAALVAVTWRLTGHVQNAWQRIFLRAGFIALCFALVPAPEMFGEAALAGAVAAIPLWFGLFSVVVQGPFFGLLPAFLAWLIVTYLLWVTGMSIHHLSRRGHGG